jgi:hypothetical protein
VGPDGQVCFEVHHLLTRRDSRLYLDVAPVWQASRPATLAGVSALAPSPEHMLLHLCAHFFLDRRFHSGAALRQLCDIAETIRRYPGGTDWGSLVAQAGALGVGKPVGFVLYFAQRLLAAPVPDHVLKTLGAPGNDGAPADLFLRRRVLDTQQWLAHDLAPSGRGHGLLRLLRAGLRRLMPDRVTLAEQYRLDPRSWRVYFYYPVRVYHVLARVGAAALRPGTIREDLALDRWMQGLYQHDGLKP